MSNFVVTDRVDVELVAIVKTLAICLEIGAASMV